MLRTVVLAALVGVFDTKGRSDMRKSIMIWMAGVMLSGCTTSNGNLATKTADKGLALNHIDAVTAAARKMVNEPSAQVHGLKSRQKAGEAGLHVCGYVRTAKTDGLPMYVELREQNGTVNAERGQIGATPENLAKVKFMCREHGEW